MQQGAASVQQLGLGQQRYVSGPQAVVGVPQAMAGPQQVGVSVPQVQQSGPNVNMNMQPAPASLGSQQLGLNLQQSGMNATQGGVRVLQPHQPRIVQYPLTAHQQGIIHTQGFPQAGTGFVHGVHQPSLIPSQPALLSLAPLPPPPPEEANLPPHWKTAKDPQVSNGRGRAMGGGVTGQWLRTRSKDGKHIKLSFSYAYKVLTKSAHLSICVYISGLLLEMSSC